MAGSQHTRSSSRVGRSDQTSQSRRRSVVDTAVRLDDIGGSVSLERQNSRSTHPEPRATGTSRGSTSQCSNTQSTISNHDVQDRGSRARMSVSIPMRRHRSPSPNSVTGNRRRYIPPSHGITSTPLTPYGTQSRRPRFSSATASFDSIGSAEDRPDGANTALMYPGKGKPKWVPPPNHMKFLKEVRDDLCGLCMTGGGGLQVLYPTSHGYENWLEDNIRRTWSRYQSEPRHAKADVPSTPSTDACWWLRERVRDKRNNSTRDIKETLLGFMNKRKASGKERQEYSLEQLSNLNYELRDGRDDTRWTGQQIIDCIRDAFYGEKGLARSAPAAKYFERTSAFLILSTLAVMQWHLQLWSLDHSGLRNGGDGEPQYTNVKQGEVQAIFDHKLESFETQAPARIDELLTAFHIRLEKGVKAFGGGRTTVECNSIDPFKDTLDGLALTDDDSDLDNEHNPSRNADNEGNGHDQVDDQDSGQTLSRQQTPLSRQQTPLSRQQTPVEETPPPTPRTCMIEASHLVGRRSMGWKGVRSAVESELGSEVDGLGWFYTLSPVDRHDDLTNFNERLVPTAIAQIKQACRKDLKLVLHVVWRSISNDEDGGDKTDEGLEGGNNGAGDDGNSSTSGLTDV